MAIETNISVTKTQKEYYQKFVNLSVNEEALPQGDGTIRISPFDDYFVFTIYDEIDNENTPIDLSNVGDLFLNFVGNNDEIIIKNHTQIEEVDLSQGEVLFKVNKSDSKKILALDNNNFYVSTKMTDPEDMSMSDETILYQGLWLSFSDASRTTLTSQIEEQKLFYSEELAKLKLENEAQKKQIEELVQNANEDTLTIQALQASNEELTNEVEQLEAKLDAAASAATKRESKKAQALANRQLKKKQQIMAIKNARLANQSKSKKKSFFKQASKNLEEYNLGAPKTSTSSGRGPGRNS
jgi:hypothetical protein|tara:strand:+ start:490 stop:1380 length:891 start_codon:yes stop_codon:yes gene_type:complete